MASEIRVNQIQNRSGLSTVTFSDTGVVISGITTISDLRTSGNTIVAAGTTSAPSISPTGDSNTGIFFPAADTVAIAEGGVEALRVDSSGRVGINSNSPNDFQVDISAPSDRPPLRIYRQRNTSGGGLLDIRSDVGGVNTREFIFASGGDLTLSTGNLVIGTAGRGIDFSATSNSSGTMTSELLSDYEEGTWTPTVIFGGNSTGITYNAQTGGYIKIGSQVTVWFYLSLSNKGSSTGDSKIASLPFTNSSVPGRSEGATFTPNYWGGFNSAIIPGGYVQVNTTLIYMVNTNAATSTGAIANSVWSNTTSLYGCVTYSIV